MKYVENVYKFKLTQKHLKSVLISSTNCCCQWAVFWRPLLKAIGHLSRFQEPKILSESYLTFKL